jgi:hypothetical protein
LARAALSGDEHDDGDLIQIAVARFAARRIRAAFVASITDPCEPHILFVFSPFLEASPH